MPEPTTPAIGVCGFGRCGSTMMMSMLIAGGMPTVEGTSLSSFEAEDFARLFQYGPDELDGRAVKLLTLVEAYGTAPPASAWKFVWLDRDPGQQALSMMKFMIGLGMKPPPKSGGEFIMQTRQLSASFRRDRPKLLGMLNKIGPVTVLSFEDVLNRPARAVRTLAKLYPDLDRQAAIAAVHDRGPKALPNLDVETALMLAEGIIPTPPPEETPDVDS